MNKNERYLKGYRALREAEDTLGRYMTPEEQRPVLEPFFEIDRAMAMEAFRKRVIAIGRERCEQTDNYDNYLHGIMEHVVDDDGERRLVSAYRTESLMDARQGASVLDIHQEMVNSNRAAGLKLIKRMAARGVEADQIREHTQLWLWD